MIDVLLRAPGRLWSIQQFQSNRLQSGTAIGEPRRIRALAKPRNQSKALGVENRPHLFPGSETAIEQLTQRAEPHAEHPAGEDRGEPGFE